MKKTLKTITTFLLPRLDGFVYLAAVGLIAAGVAMYSGPLALIVTGAILLGDLFVDKITKKMSKGQKR